MSEHTNDELEAVITEKDEEISRLETQLAEVNAELLTLREENAPERVVRSITSYRPGDFVQVAMASAPEPVHGKVIEVVPGGSAVIVGTAKGQVTIADPTRIGKQSDKW